MDSSEYLCSSTTGISPGALGIGYVKPQTIRERVDEWWLGPLLSMGGHEGFVCLAVCLPLLERVIKFEVGANDEEAFHETSDLVKRLATRLEIAKDDAHDFWQMFRNGVCHRAMPKLYKSRTYEVAERFAVPIHVAGEHFFVNPWKLRDLTVSLVNSNRKMWRDSEYPLAEVYKATEAQPGPLR